MSSSTLDLTRLTIVFTTRIHMVSVAAGLLSNRHQLNKIPHDVIEEMVCEFIHDHNVWPL
jgi:hypothetical protein